MDTFSQAALTRAALSAGVFAGVAFLMGGGNAGLTNYAVGGGIQAAASLGSDVVHGLLMRYPTTITSSVATGGLFTAAQYLLGDRDHALTNYVVSAGSEYSVRVGQNMLQKKNQDAAAADADEEEYLA